MKKIRAIVEMPMKSNYKYEVNKTTGALRLDRPISRSVPFNYGYIPHTVCLDVDPIDLFLVSRYPIPPLTEVDVQLVGVFKCTDNGVSDDKLIGTLGGENITGNAQKEAE